jgi:Na+-translocating ferredoxin:NAD+ oxidoreductase RnfD subunit
MSDAAITWASFQPAITEIALGSAICLILLIDVFAGQTRRGVTSLATLIALAGTAWLTVQFGSDWHCSMAKLMASAAASAAVSTTCWR